MLQCLHHSATNASGCASLMLTGGSFAVTHHATLPDEVLPLSAELNARKSGTGADTSFVALPSFADCMVPVGVPLEADIVEGGEAPVVRL